MKISEFAEKFDVSNDTVRYYMKLNLIIPEKKGGHYHFNFECERDMLQIIKLKEMDFSMLEIKEIFYFNRIGKLSSYQRNHYYQSLYRGKVREIERKIAELHRAKDALEVEIADLVAENDDHPITMGIDISTLHLFSCSRCQRELKLSADKVESNQIIIGSLNCSCGQSYQIKDGILYAHNLKQESEQVEKYHLEEYIISTDPVLLDKSYQSLDWLQRQLEPEDLEGKTILEPGSGYGHFLRQIYHRLREETIYICVDHNPQVNQYLKRLLEMTGKRRNVIFISADFRELPLKDGIVDFVVDFTGTTNFSFEHTEFLPELLDRYFKRTITILATFIIYHKFGPNNIVTGPYRHNFTVDNIRKRLVELDYELETEYRTEPIEIENTMGKYEEFAQIGDKIYPYQLRAKRWS